MKGFGDAAAGSLRWWIKTGASPALLIAMHSFWGARRSRVRLALLPSTSELLCDATTGRARGTGEKLRTSICGSRLFAFTATAAPILKQGSP